MGSFIGESLSPAKAVKVTVKEDDKSAFVVVPDNQLSLAIGKAGQNVRLAARLTGWRIDIRSEAQVARATFMKMTENDTEDEEDEATVTIGEGTSASKNEIDSIVIGSAVHTLDGGFSDVSETAASEDLLIGHAEE